MAQPQAEIRCCILRETEKAYQIEFGSNAPVWVPKSQILDDDIPATDYAGTGEIFSIFLPQWLAEEKGLV
jgi:hypothetical protein